MGKIGGLKTEYDIISYKLASEYQKLLTDITTQLTFDEVKECYVDMDGQVIKVIITHINQKGVYAKTDTGEIILLVFKNFINKYDLIDIIKKTYEKINS